ncbi:hypothetical protein JW921_05435 [Candidatus Fermentibacterales bacterium]|nr:hypothetical protein [Candidatus Fermentibacterales bacterium]
MSYTSETRILGVPLIDIRVGRAASPSRGVARAWIAVGDVAFGILFAAGGVSVGGVAIGGCSFGTIALGGLAVGGVSLGGGSFAMLLAVGGMAASLHSAAGGLAIARLYAVGGNAIARHANDKAASGFLEFPAVFGNLLEGFSSSSPLIHLCWVFPAIALLAGRRNDDDDTPYGGDR